MAVDENVQKGKAEPQITYVRLIIVCVPSML